MSGQLGEVMKQLQMMQRLMKDDHFKALMSHPNVQELFKDQQFLALIKSQDMAKIAAYPKLVALMRDPDLAPLFTKLNPARLFSTGGVNPQALFQA